MVTSYCSKVYGSWGSSAPLRIVSNSACALSDRTVNLHWNGRG